jgi:hypothetical protein
MEGNSMQTRTILLASIALAVLSLLAACGGLSTKQKTAAHDTLKALRKIDAAAQVGTSYQQYKQMIIEAQAAMSEASASLPDGELKNELSKAVEADNDALIAWESANNREMYGGSFFSGRVDFNAKSKDGQALHEKYKIEYEQKDRLMAGTYPLDVALPAIWKVAKEHLDSASKLLEE